MLVDDDSDANSVKDIIADHAGQGMKVAVVGRSIRVSGATDYELFSANGARVSSGSPLLPGVYVVKSGKKATKVVVR